MHAGLPPNVTALWVKIAIAHRLQFGGGKFPDKHHPSALPVPSAGSALQPTEQHVPGSPRTFCESPTKVWKGAARTTAGRRFRCPRSKIVRNTGFGAIDDELVRVVLLTIASANFADYGANFAITYEDIAREDRLNCGNTISSPAICLRPQSMQRSTRCRSPLANMSLMGLGRC
jgi:hypothetical protein